MPINPLSIPYFIPVLWRLALILGLIVCSLVAGHYRNRQHSDSPDLLRKAVTVAWLAPLLLGTIFAGGLILFAVLVIVMAQSIREYSALVALDKVYERVLQLYSLGGLVTAATAKSILFLEYPFGLVAVTFAIPILSQQIRGAYESAGQVVVAYFFISFPITLILFIRLTVSWGLRFLVIVGIATAVADAGAFIVGSRLKGPKLAPAVSPMKTWSGAFGSLLGAAIGVVISWEAAPRYWQVLIALFTTLCVAMAATLGDLAESVIKRSFDQKDAGTVLVGFGGLLDRFDSFLFTIPAAFVLLSQVFRLHG